MINPKYSHALQHDWNKKCTFEVTLTAETMGEKCQGDLTPPFPPLNNRDGNNDDDDDNDDELYRGV